MAAIFSVLILAMRTETVGALVNVVKEVDCTVTASESGVVSSMSVTAPLGDVDVIGFVPYPELTEETVLGWVDAVLTAQQSKPYLQQMIDSAIAMAAFARPALPWT